MANKVILTAKANLLEPDSIKFKSVAASVEKYGLILQPQMDLLYIESCLVSAGTKAGINDNDDIFTCEETWKARCTPVLKPLNWQHTDKDIVGVMYSVQARDLKGNVIDLNSDTAPEEDYDLWTEAVVFKFINPVRSVDIEERAKAGNLFVSMEAWFDDYSYGVCDTTGSLNEVISRDKTTAFLDKHLRAYKGTGSYEGKRIGRVLRSITFGGCGLVDKPANKRSKISEVNQSVTIANESDQLLDFFNGINMEELVMNAQANQVVDPKKVINDVLDEREDRHAKAAAQEAQRVRANELEAKQVKLEQEVNTLSKALNDKKVEVDNFNKQFNTFNEVVDSLLHTVKGSAADDLVAKIDAALKAKDVEAIFQAKMEFIKETAVAYTKATAELSKSKLNLREQEVKALFSDLLPEDSVNALVVTAKRLGDEDYQNWKTEKELFAIEMTNAKKADPEEGTEPSDNPEEEAQEKMKDLVKKKKKNAKSEIDPIPGSSDIVSGVNPGELRTPRFKIAGSAAGDRLAEELENVQVKGNKVNLAGAEAGEDEGQENPFRSLANLLTEDEKSSESK